MHSRLSTTHQSSRPDLLTHTHPICSILRLGFGPNLTWRRYPKRSIESARHADLFEKAARDLESARTLSMCVCVRETDAGWTYRLVAATVVIGAGGFVGGFCKAHLLFAGGHGRVYGLDGEDALVGAGGPAGEGDVCGYVYDRVDGCDGFDDDC